MGRIESNVFLASLILEAPFYSSDESRLALVLTILLIFVFVVCKTGRF